MEYNIPAPAEATEKCAACRRQIEKGGYRLDALRVLCDRCAEEFWGVPEKSVPLIPSGLSAPPGAHALSAVIDIDGDCAACGRPVGRQAHMLDHNRVLCRSCYQRSEALVS